MKKLFVFIGLIIIIFYWQHATTPESKRSFNIPAKLQAFGEYKSIVLKWESPNTSNKTGYMIYYGKKSSEYTDTLITYNTNLFRIPDLEDNTRYYCAIAVFHDLASVSKKSPEISAITYVKYENFKQTDGPLNSKKWRTEKNYITPVNNQQVGAAEIEAYMGRIKRSFGQYRLIQPKDNVAVECEFKLGNPNVGGAGVMLRSEKVRSNRYYKGYNAYLYWTGQDWELRLEECQVDHQTMERPAPVKIPSLEAGSWVKIRLEKMGRQLQASVVKLPDYSQLASIEYKYDKKGARPKSKDHFCGFYTCQYGGNTIIVDNFGIQQL